MRLVASLVVKNELARYLKPCVTSLLNFCDEVRVLDDTSTDGSFEWLSEQPRVSVTSYFGTFYDHEGAARNALLKWTFRAEPTHVLAIDADEFVSDGPLLRARIAAEPQVPVWTLDMLEVWKAGEDCLWIRRDGGWKPHGVGIVYALPPEGRRDLDWTRVADRALACGREPLAARKLEAKASGVEVLHFGWAKEEERRWRWERYMEHDRGRFHNRKHLDSIMWPDERVQLQHRPWPPGLNALLR